MWPWGHLALGYLAYAGLLALRRQGTPAAWPVVALAVGTQFPDLVDKPLAYTVPLLPAGRSLTHSVFVFVPLCILLVWVARRRGRTEPALAFAVGYATHLVGDGAAVALAGRYERLTFLVWPLLPLPDYEVEGFGDFARRLLVELARLDAARLTAWDEPFVLELWLGLAVLVLWAAQGMPPLLAFGRWLGARLSRR